MSSKYNDYDHILYSLYNLPPEVTSALRNQIDTEIADLKSRLQYLCYARNALAPVYSLPDELLTKVFALSRVGERGKILGKSMLPASWVSHRWRNVALGAPKLWDRIDDTNRRWASLCLLRSKNVPLFVSISRKLFSKESDSLFNELHRIQHLEFGTWDRNPDISGVDLSAVEISGFQRLPSNSRAITILQTLQIQATSLPHANLASYSMPRLAHLKLMACLFNWQDLLVPSLRTIHITDPDFKKNVNDVLRILSKMPLLEEATFTRVLCGPGELATRATSGGGLPLVHLPNLTSFNVQDTNIDCMTDLLHGVVVPAHACLCITFDTYSQGADLLHPAMFVTLFQPLFQCVKNRFKFNGTSESLDTMGISNKNHDELAFGFGHRDTEHGIRNLVTIKAIGQLPQILPFNFVVQCLSGLPLHVVQRLELTGHWNLALDVEYNPFLDLLSHMPIVEEVVFQRRIGAEFLRRLAVSSTASLPPSVKSVVCSQICSGIRMNPLTDLHIKSLGLRRKNNWVDARMILVESQPRNETLKWLEDLFDEVYYDKPLDLVFFSDGGH